MSDKVSIVMPAYNVGHYLEETIASVQAQTHQDWELVIIDDESNDNTAEIAQRLASQDARIHYKWQKNGKQGKARNNGISGTTGDYIAFLDADDVWVPTKLATQLALLKEKNVDLVFGNAYLLKDGVKSHERIGRGSGHYQGETAIRFLLFGDAFIMSTVLVKKSALRQVDYFEEDLKIQYCEDWHIWLKLAFAGFSFYTDTAVVSYYRIHASSAASVETQAQIKFFYALLNLHEKYGGHESLNGELARRAEQLVFNSVHLDRELVQTILFFLKKQQSVRWPIPVLLGIHHISIPLFRKVFFLAIHKSHKRDDN